MKYQVRDSGILAPVAKQPEPSAPNLYELEQQRRMEAGFPKIIKVVIDGNIHRLCIEGDDIYTDSEDCKIGVRLLSSLSLSTYMAGSVQDWRRIEYEILC